MTQISFYQLTVLELKRALPKLLSKALEQESKIMILSNNQDSLKQLNDDLWSATRAFIPHCLWNDESLEKYPVILNYTEENLNDAEYIFCVDGFKLEKLLGKAKRVFDVFSGQDPAEVVLARERYKSYKSQNYALDYYKQKSNGSWEKS